MDPPPYIVDHFEIVLTLADGRALAANAFRFAEARDERRRFGPCPPLEFYERTIPFNQRQHPDEGARLAGAVFLVQMRQQLLLSRDQTEQARLLMLNDPSPLVRRVLADDPDTWTQTLVDGDRRVRLAALRAAAANASSAPANAALRPILLARIQDGDRETRLLALRALKYNLAGGIGRECLDTVRQAMADPDAEVRRAAREHHSFWVSAWPEGVPDEPAGAE